MSKKDNKVVDLNEYATNKILDDAGKAIEDTENLINEAVETLPKEQLMEFLKEANDILEPLAEQFKKLNENSDENT